MSQFCAVIKESKIYISKEIIVNSRIIAKGKRIRELNRLLKEYGGTSSKWVKKSSIPFKENEEYFEYHWYEHHGIGRFETKKKKVS